MTLHKLHSPWGEGDSNAQFEEGGGATAYKDDHAMSLFKMYISCRLDSRKFKGNTAVQFVQGWSV
jgi:hypothetical protein